jgi:transposase-like protein
VSGVLVDPGVASCRWPVDMRELRSQDVGDGRDDLSSFPVVAAVVVRGDVVRVRAEERRLRVGVAAGARVRVLPNGVGVAAQNFAGRWSRPDANRWAAQASRSRWTPRSSGGRSPVGRAGVRYANKDEAVIAVELRHPKGLGRVRMARIDSQHRKEEIFDFAKANLAAGTILYTDGDRLYSGLTRELDIIHERLIVVSSHEPAHRLLPAVHRVVSLLKRWLAGTFHNGQGPDHLGYYLDEFTFRFNRRTSRSRGLLWYRLISQSVVTEPHPYRQLTA